jgi:hypothetical protein
MFRSEFKAINVFDDKMKAKEDMPYLLSKIFNCMLVTDMLNGYIFHTTKNELGDPATSK